MPCEKYQAALIDLAATDAEPTGKVRVHLDACASCRSYFEQEQFLLAAIDSAVHATANAPLPTSVHQRFEARFAQEASTKRIANPGWMYAAAVAAALIVLTLPILRPRKLRERVAALDAQQHVAKPSVAEETPGAIPVDTARVNPEGRRRRSKRVARPVENTEAEVLVPPDERVAFERFLFDLNGRKDLAAALVKPAVGRHERLDPPIETRDIQTASLSVQPLIVQPIIVQPLEKSNDK